MTNANDNQDTGRTGGDAGDSIHSPGTDDQPEDSSPIVKREKKHEGAAVRAALIANIGVAIAKLVAWFFTKSSAMLSESVHSIADCSNEIVLRLGDKASRKTHSTQHPFGWYRVKYLASFVVATLLFFVGGFFSTSEAAKKIIAMHTDASIRTADRMELFVALIIVAVSACLESYSLHQSVKEANERMEATETPHMGIYRFWRVTKSADLASVIMEDTLALIGLVFAFLGIGLAIVTGDELYDALGGLGVGIVLIIGSILLAYKNGSLLIGESVDKLTQQKIIETVEATPGVEDLLNMQSVHMSEDNVLLCLKVQTSKLDRDYDVTTVNRIESGIRSSMPWFNWEIYVEPDVYREEQDGKPDEPVDLPVKTVTVPTGPFDRASEGQSGPVHVPFRIVMESP